MHDRALPRRGERTLASAERGTARPWVAVGRRRFQRRERALTNLVRVASGPARRVGAIPESCRGGVAAAAARLAVLGEVARLESGFRGRYGC